MADTERDEYRWQQAFTVLADGRTDAARRALRPALRRVWIFTISIVVVALIAGLAVAGFLVRSPSQDSDPSWARLLVGLALNFLGVTVLVTGMVRWALQGRLTEAWRAPALVLSRSQRRSLLRQVRGREPVNVEVLPLTRDVAARIARGSPLTLLAGILVQQAGQALMFDTALFTGYFMVLLGVYVVLGAWALWVARRAARFLRTHPAG